MNDNVYKTPPNFNALHKFYCCYNLFYYVAIKELIITNIKFRVFFKLKCNSYYLISYPFKVYDSVGALRIFHKVEQPSPQSNSRTFHTRKRNFTSLSVTFHIPNPEPLATTSLLPVSMDLLKVLYIKGPQLPGHRPVLVMAC